MNIDEPGSTDVAPTRIEIETLDDIKYFVLTFTDSDKAGMYYRNSDSKESYYNLKHIITTEPGVFKVMHEVFLNQLGESTAYKTSKIFESKDRIQINKHNRIMNNMRTDVITF